MSGVGTGRSSRERQADQDAISFSTNMRENRKRREEGWSTGERKDATEKPALRRKNPNGEKGGVV